MRWYSWIWLVWTEGELQPPQEHIANAHATVGSYSQESSHCAGRSLWIDGPTPYRLSRECKHAFGEGATHSRNNQRLESCAFRVQQHNVILFAWHGRHYL